MAINGNAVSGNGNSVISLQEINTKRIQFKEGLETVVDSYKEILKQLQEFQQMKGDAAVGKASEELIAKINEILVGLQEICNKHYAYLLTVLSGREEMDAMQNADLFNKLQEVGLATGAGDGQNSTTANINGNGNNVQSAGRDMINNYYQRAGRDVNGHAGVGNTGHAGYGNTGHAGIGNTGHAGNGNSGNIAAQGNGVGNEVTRSNNDAGNYNGNGSQKPTTPSYVVPGDTGRGNTSSSSTSTTHTDRYWKSTITTTTPETQQTPSLDQKFQIAGGASQSKINLVNNVPASSGFSGGSGGGGSVTYNTYNYPQAPAAPEVKAEPVSTPAPAVEQNAGVVGKGNASNVVGDANVVGNNMNAQSLNGDAVNQAGLLNDNSHDFVGTVFGDFDDSNTSVGNNNLGQDFTKAGLGLLGLGGAGLAYGAYKYNQDKKNENEDEMYFDNQM